MKYQQLKFRDLPFQPRHDQVFYVEDSYSPEINDFIDSHYYELCVIMLQCNMQLCYMPRLISTAGTDRKLRYYAPYLSEALITSRRVESNAILRFLADRKQTVEPSFIFSPQSNGEKGETIFLQLPLSEVCKNGGYNINDIIRAIKKVNEAWQSARIGQLCDRNNLRDREPDNAACSESDLSYSAIIFVTSTGLL